jgi:hypothetical protein
MRNFLNLSPARAKKTYEQVFTFWKAADPVLGARKEYAALK